MGIIKSGFAQINCTFKGKPTTLDPTPRIVDCNMETCRTSRLLEEK